MKVVSKLEDLMWKNRIKSINQLSEETGITRTTLTRLKDNKAQGVQLETLETLCDFFGIELHELLVTEREEVNTDGELQTN